MNMVYCRPQVLECIGLTDDEAGRVGMMEHEILTRLPGCGARWRRCEAEARGGERVLVFSGPGHGDRATLDAKAFMRSHTSYATDTLKLVPAGP